MANPCPPIDEALLRWLDETYPERTPRKGTSLEDIWFEAGSREVVRNLIQQLERQNTLNVHVNAQAQVARPSAIRTAGTRSRT